MKKLLLTAAVVLCLPFLASAATTNSLTFSSAPVLGNSTTISGNCATTSGNANGSVAFTSANNGVLSTLPTAGYFTDSYGYFSSLVLFPASLGANALPLVATCPDGSTLSNSLILGDAVPAVVSITDPVGGVAAGAEPQSQNTSGSLIFGEILMIVGLAGLFAVTNKNSHARKQSI